MKNISESEKHFIDSIFNSAEQEEREQCQEPTHKHLIAELKSAFNALNNELYIFEPGDIVEFKPRMRNLIIPKYGQPCIVSRILAEPILIGNKSSSLDMVIITTDPAGDFFELPVDSRRFQHFGMFKD